MARNYGTADTFSQTLMLLPSAVWRAVRHFVERERTTIAAAMAYYSLFSLFPLALLILAAVAYIRPDLAAHGPILSLTSTYIPGAEAIVRTNLERLVNARSGVGFFGLLSLVWSASSVFAAMGRALEKSLGRPAERSPFRLRLIGLLMVVITASLAVASLAATTVLTVLSKEGSTLKWSVPALFPWLGVDVLNLLAAGLSLVTVFCATLLIYRYFPPSSPPVRDLWPGALLATLGLAVARNVFADYVAGIGEYELIYGSLGAVIVVLLWFFVSAGIFLWGAEVGGALHEMRPTNGRTRDRRS